MDWLLPDKCHLPTKADVYLLLVSSLMNFCKIFSEVDIWSPAHFKPVLKPYLPVIIEPLVGVQVGLTQKLLNDNPEFFMAFKFGVFGFIGALIIAVLSGMFPVS